jgi:hypothetical protein
MKTSVAITSIRSYSALKASGFVGQYAAIVSRMERGRMYSRRQLSVMTGLETSAVAGRINELLEDGDVVVCGHIKCPHTGRLVGGVKLADRQLEIFA